MVLRGMAFSIYLLLVLGKKVPRVKRLSLTKPTRVSRKEGEKCISVFFCLTFPVVCFDLLQPDEGRLYVYVHAPTLQTDGREKREEERNIRIPP